MEFDTCLNRIGNIVGENAKKLKNVIIAVTFTTPAMGKIQTQRNEKPS